jgi:hypothetical protein
MREFFLADQSGVRPEIDNDDFPFEVLDQFAHLVVRNGAKFDLRFVGFIRGEEEDTGDGRRKEKVAGMMHTEFLH